MKAFVFENNALQNHLYAHILYCLSGDSFTYFAKSDNA